MFTTTSVLKATIAAAVLTAGTTLPALSADDAPVVLLGYSSSERGPSIEPFVTIAFENTRDQPAKAVVFRISDDRGHDTLVTDVGNFSKGTPIDGTFVASGLRYEQARNGHAEIVEVQFADGSTWERPAPETAAPTWWSR